jgi:hypothetical protein
MFENLKCLVCKQKTFCYSHTMAVMGGVGWRWMAVMQILKSQLSAARRNSARPNEPVCSPTMAIYGGNESIVAKGHNHDHSFIFV